MPDMCCPPRGIPQVKSTCACGGANRTNMRSIAVTPVACGPSGLPRQQSSERGGDQIAADADEDRQRVAVADIEREAGGARGDQRPDPGAGGGDADEAVGMA